MARLGEERESLQDNVTAVQQAAKRLESEARAKGREVEESTRLVRTIEEQHAAAGDEREDLSRFDQATRDLIRKVSEMDQSANWEMKK